MFKHNHAYVNRCKFYKVESLQLKLCTCMSLKLMRVSSRREEKLNQRRVISIKCKRALITFPFVRIKRNPLNNTKWRFSKLKQWKEISFKIVWKWIFAVMQMKKYQVFLVQKLNRNMFCCCFYCNGVQWRQPTSFRYPKTVAGRLQRSRKEPIHHKVASKYML